MLVNVYHHLTMKYLHKSMGQILQQHSTPNHNPIEEAYNPTN